MGLNHEGLGPLFWICIVLRGICCAFTVLPAQQVKDGLLALMQHNCVAAYLQEVSHGHTFATILQIRA